MGTVIDIEQLVRADLEPVFDLDPTLEDAILDRIDAEIALLGWINEELTDQQMAYVAILVTRAFIPRLLLRFAQELRRAKGGTAEAEFNDAIKYLKALQEELKERQDTAARETNPSILPTEIPPWPGVGVLPW